MQHNWWIATLERLGLITRVDAQKLSDTLKSTIHRESYQETAKDLSAILTSKLPDIKKLEADVEKLKAEVLAKKPKA